MTIKYIVLILIFYIVSGILFAGNEEYFIVKPKPGDGKEILLTRYCIPATKNNIKLFESLNKRKFTRKGELMMNMEYRLPVRIYKYDGKNLKSTLKIREQKKIDQILAYNEKLYVKGIIKKPYMKSSLVYVPVIDIPAGNTTEIADKAEKPLPELKKKKRKNTEIVPIFGTNYEQVKISGRSLEGNVYYLDPGHGGPDPGAIGSRNGKELCEDEYAYDITLRLGRKLIEQGAKVYIIVRDTNDGIRDGELLQPDEDEFYLGDYQISDVQKTRLDKRAAIINDLYEENESTAKSQQLIVIHLDSRVTEKRIDIFFYNKPDCRFSKSLAQALCSTVKAKYNSKQPGRGYNGSVSPRNLLMLRETKPTSVYIELGNIQNPNDQYRFLNKDNRQAIANWLYQGLASYAARK